MEIRISNLNSHTTTSDLQHHFSDFNIKHISKVTTISDVSKNNMKTYCFLTIDDRAEGTKAIEQLNGTNLWNANIIVEEGG